MGVFNALIEFSAEITKSLVFNRPCLIKKTGGIVSKIESNDLVFLDCTNEVKRFFGASV